jgi:hypothetical protein
LGRIVLTAVTAADVLVGDSVTVSSDPEAAPPKESEKAVV